MSNNIQFALFFEEGTIYNPTKLSAKIINKFSEIEDPIILPINTEAPKEANIPFMIFNQNPNFQIISNFNNLVITVKGDYIGKIEEIINEIFEIFKKEDISFIRIGYIPSIFIDKEEISKFKNEYMNSDIFADTVEFQFSWLKKLKLDQIEINCWERNITDSANFEGLLKCFDFNTSPSKKIDIDKKFIGNFIEFCNEYIDQRK